MEATGPVNLGDLLTHSLSLQLSSSLPSRSMFPHHVMKDHYKEFVEQDPLRVLGETNFGKPNIVSEDTNGTPIQEFYRGVNVLITGGTGFIGKVLTEKLIRSIPHIGHVYLLIRAKRGKSCQERFEQLLENKLFSRMKTEVPHYYTKITAIDGDLSEPDLGLSDADHQLLLDKVHVVFHSAADVRFTEPLKVTIASNVLGSRRVLDMAKSMKNLKSYVHVSTAYSQCVRRVIDETVPKLNINYKDVLNIVETTPDLELEDQTARIMQGWPNTYTFSKAVCEDMIQEEAEDLPVCIFRPSVVLPTYREPVRGWTDNVYGPVGLLVGAGHGILHCGRVKEELSLDIVPVDYTVNCMIAAAWRMGGEDKTTTRDRLSMPVYNFTSSPMRQGCWKHLISFALSHKETWPYSRAIWYTSYFSCESHVLHTVAHFFLHKIPAIFFDKLAELSGEKPRLSKIYDRIYGLRGQLSYFVARTWEFKNNNVMDLWELLNDEDKNLFYFDVRDVDWKELFLICKLGFRYYYLNEPMENLPAASRKNTWLFWVHNSLKLICAFAALKLMVITARILPF